MKDLYKTLGIEKTATVEEIKSAYRKLALRYHPDRNPNDKVAEEMFKKIAAAYSVLSDPNKRSMYDATGQSDAYGPKPEGFSGSPFDNDSRFNEMFNEIFGEMFNKQRGTKTSLDIRLDLYVSLEDVFKGSTIKFAIPNEYVVSQREIQFSLPKSISHGETIGFRNKGITNNSQTGTVYLRILQKPHPNFERDGLDLHMDLFLPITVLVLGGEVVVPVIDGGTIAVSIASGTAVGKLLRVPQRGLFYDDKQRGNMYYHLNVDIPTKLTKEQKKLFEQLDKLLKKDK